LLFHGLSFASAVAFFETNHTSNQHQETSLGNSSQKENRTVAPSSHHARLDVGFLSFEKRMLESVKMNLDKATAGAPWTKQVRTACMENATNSLSQGLKSQLRPLKQSIGKTWMALPEEEERNAYVKQLSAAYASDFKDSLETIESHLQRSFHHLGLRLKGKVKASADELLSRCEDSISGNLMSERCYDINGGQHPKTTKTALSFLQSNSISRQKFCMPSVFEALAHRLKDVQGLIGMTMQFESKSMSLQTTPSAVNDIVQAAGAMGH
jgi:hypothetical protein